MSTAEKNVAELAYGTYWKRKQMIAQGVPRFPVVHCWWYPGYDLLSPNNRKVIETVRDASALLDVGAGDLRIKGMIQGAGFRGEYHTQDIGGEYAHTYQSLDDVDRKYPAILCLDVLEHLTLGDGLGMLQRLAELLEPGGVLIIQTPNALCIRTLSGWDMTHIQCYNASDLWAFLRVLGLEVEGYRVTLGYEPRGPLRWMKAKLRENLAKLMRVDHAENLVMIARKAGPPTNSEVGVTSRVPATN